jgi:hypothetical protein
MLLILKLRSVLKLCTFTDKEEHRRKWISEKTKTKTFRRRRWFRIFTSTTRGS